MTDAERLDVTLEAERLKGAECLMQALFESLTKGYSSGQVCGRFAELAGLSASSDIVRCFLTGVLTVNNALYDVHCRDYEGKPC